MIYSYKVHFQPHKTVFPTLSNFVKLFSRKILNLNRKTFFCRWEKEKEKGKEGKQGKRERKRMQGFQLKRSKDNILFKILFFIGQSRRATNCFVVASTFASPPFRVGLFSASSRWESPIRSSFSIGYVLRRSQISHHSNKSRGPLGRR